MAKVQKNFRFDEDVIEALQYLTELRAEKAKKQLGVDNWNMTAELTALIMGAYQKESKKNK